MSDYCSNCAYDHKAKQGERACPFNYLYWNFLITQEDRLRKNPRMGLAYRNLDRMPEERRRELADQAASFLSRLGD